MISMHHSCRTFLRISPTNFLHTDDSFVYTKEKNFFRVCKLHTEEGRIHPDNFTCKKLIVEEVVWPLLVERDIYKDLNVSKLGIYKFIGYEPGDYYLPREEIEGNASQNFLKNSEDVYFCMVPKRLCRSN